MSDPKRYGFPWLECDATDEAYMQENGMTELKDGGFVLWADYARLKAEVEAHEKRWAESEDLISHYKQQRDEAINDCECSRLKAEVESLKEAWVDKKMQEDRDALLRENERLRKAGDAMACHLVCSDLPNDVCGDLMKNWNAAKEVQS